MSDMDYGFTNNTEYDNTGYSQYTKVPDDERGTKHPEKKKGKSMIKRMFICIGSGALFGVTAALAFWGIASVTVLDKLPSQSDDVVQIEEEQKESILQETTDVPNTQAATTVGTATVADVAKMCTPSVVAITCTSIEEVQSFWGTQSYQSEGAGSGIIVAQNEKELLIATNNHVVSGAQSLSVCFNDDKEQVYEAVIKGTDPSNDLAVIAINAKGIKEDTLQQIKVATWGDSDTLTIGEQIVAIGNALGHGQSVTSGVVSALNREVTIDNMTASLIQVDAAINPGNSGGALFNMKGELVGINSAKYASEAVEGMGYAIPITKAREILDELMARQTRTKVAEEKRGYLGISCVDVSKDASEMYDLPNGVYVKEVGQGGAAHEAGIQAGDIITKFDGLRIYDKESLISNLEYYAAGETVDVVLQRAGDGGYKEITLQVTLDKQVLSDNSQNNTYSPKSENEQRSENESSQLPYGFGDLFDFFR